MAPCRQNQKTSAQTHDAAGLAHEFSDISGGIIRQVEAVHPKLPELCTYLDGINTKLDMLANWLAARELGLPTEPTHQVELSASGIALINDRQLDLDTTLEVRLLLFPERVCMRLNATVVRCDRMADSQFDLALDFEAPDEGLRDRLAAHVIRLHSQMIRARTSEIAADA